MDNELFKMAGNRNNRYLDFPPNTKVRMNSQKYDDAKTTMVVGYMFIDAGGLILKDGLGENQSHFLFIDDVEIVP